MEQATTTCVRASIDANKSMPLRWSSSAHVLGNFLLSEDPYQLPRGSRVAWSILERLGRLDGSSNLPYPIGLRHADEVTVGTTT